MPRLKLMSCVALAACLTLAACGDDGGGGADGGSLRVVGTADTQPAAEAVVAEFRKAYPDVQVEASFTPTDQYTTTTRTQLGGSNGADVLLVFSGGGNTMSALALGREGALMDLSDEEWVDRVPDPALKEVSVDGEVYSFPSGFDTIGVVHDRNLWSENDVEVPSTWTGFLDTCDIFNEKGITPVSVGMATEFVPQFISYALVPSTVYQTEPDFDAEQAAGEASFSDSGWKEAFERYTQLAEAGCFGKDFIGLTYERMLAQVASGDAAMAITVAPSFPAIREANPDGDFAMFPSPRTTTRSSTPYPPVCPSGGR